MKLKKIINKSWCGIVNYIANQHDIDVLEAYVKTNYDVLKEFKGIVVATNWSYPQYGGNYVLQETHKIMWLSHFPDAVIIDNPYNRGHSFGTADLDNLVVRFCKENDLPWLCKISGDVVMMPEVLDIDVEKADFYYMNGFSRETLDNHGFNYWRVFAEYFYPQTNFYLINVDKIDYLNDDDYLNETYKQVNNYLNYNGKPWEYIDGWSNEGFLAECVNRNKLSKCNLVDRDTHQQLCIFVEKFNIGDPSHKNLQIKGITHLHFPDQKVLTIK